MVETINIPEWEEALNFDSDVQDSVPDGYYSLNEIKEQFEKAHGWTISTKSMRNRMADAVKRGTVERIKVFNENNRIVFYYKTIK